MYILESSMHQQVSCEDRSNFGFSCPIPTCCLNKRMREGDVKYIHTGSALFATKKKAKGHEAAAS